MLYFPFLHCSSIAAENLFPINKLIFLTQLISLNSLDASFLIKLIEDGVCDVIIYLLSFQANLSILDHAMLNSSIVMHNYTEMLICSFRSLLGAYDALLKWPFDYRVTFYLLDQNEDASQRKHIKFSIKPNPCADNEPFLGRPRLEKNASFGGAKFAKHEEVESRQYIKDDVIYLKITAECDGSSEP